MTGLREDIVHVNVYWTPEEGWRSEVVTYRKYMAAGGYGDFTGQAKIRVVAPEIAFKEIK